MSHSTVATHEVRSLNLPIPAPRQSRRPKKAAEQQQHAALIDNHLPLVRYLATRVHHRLPPSVDLESLFQAGVVGLLDAARRYDSHRNVKFKSYATLRINGEIMEYLRSLDLGSRWTRSRGRQLAAAQQSFAARCGKEASSEELAQELGVSLEEYYKIARGVSAATVVNFEDADLTGKGEELNIQSPVLSAILRDPSVIIEQEDLVEKLTAAIKQLPEQERQVLTLCYHEELTLRETGEVMNLTEGRICQIRTAAVVHLRQLLGFGQKSEVTIH